MHNIDAKVEFHHIEWIKSFFPLQQNEVSQCRGAVTVCQLEDTGGHGAHLDAAS